MKTVEKCVSILKIILEKLRSMIEYKGRKSTLSTLLKEIGFKLNRTRSNRMVLIENLNIRKQRVKNYLQVIKKYREKKDTLYIQMKLLDYFQIRCQNHGLIRILDKQHQCQRDNVS